VSLTVLSVGFPLAPVSPRTAGGAEQVLLTLDHALIRRRHRSLVLAPDGSRCHGLLIPVEVPQGALDRNAKRDAQHAFKRTLDRTLARFSVDVVHFHGLDFHEYLPKNHVPLVATLHLPLAWYAPQALRAHSSGDARSMELVCVSHHQSESASREVRISAVIPNGVDVEEFALQSRRGNYAVVIGRICPEKGLHLALDAAERAGIPVIIAGKVFDYPEHRAYFEIEIGPRLGKTVSFIGEIGGKAKARLLSGARCLLLPSQAPETSSLVAMEAMAAGTPAIVWNSGALPEIVTDGRTGFIVSSVDQMADAIQRIGTIRSEHCREEARRRFNSERMIDEYLGLYSAMIREPALEVVAA
jgi:glycosyltransferase involved in cell wall biosynthesis